MKHLLAIFVATTLCFGLGNRYENPTLGFTFEKPSSWQYVSLDDYYDQLVLADLGDIELEKTLFEKAAIPTLIVTKHPGPIGKINPNVKISVHPLNTYKGHLPDVILTMVSDQYNPGLNATKSPKSLRLGCCQDFPLHTCKCAINTAYKLVEKSVSSPTYGSSNGHATLS